MRSFPNMVDLALTPAEKSTEAQGLVMPNVSDLPDYDYGLNISFNEDTLKKLGLNEEDVNVGDWVHLHCFAKVTNINQKPGADKPDRINLVLTHVSAEDEDAEGEGDDEGKE